MNSDFALLPGDGFRFLTGNELPVATDEFTKHDRKHNEGWIKCGSDFSFLTATKLRKAGIFVRRAK